MPDMGTAAESLPSSMPESGRIDASAAGTTVSAEHVWIPMLTYLRPDPETAAESLPSSEPADGRMFGAGSTFTESDHT